MCGIWIYFGMGMVPKALIGAFNIVSVTLTIHFFAQLTIKVLQIFVFICKVPS